ncbi:unnamed protein product [Rhizoctonia solani]|uniref:Cytochrome c domain-containing protein n=1 Tax=Rhizoctonia solani TaxID=456999 RepID=A0A8H3HWC1_9AGAM|nr:unnamed protein product [Rhizoctonia solani]
MSDYQGRVLQHYVLLSQSISYIHAFHAGNAADGARIFKRVCAKCHSLAGQGDTKTGRPLDGVYGRPFTRNHHDSVTTVSRTEQSVWDDHNLDLYLRGPGSMIGAPRMFAPPIPEKNRKDLIALLKKHPWSRSGAK